jgi:hypothetical protein
MRRAVSSLSLALSFALFFLLAQAGAVAHEFSHFAADADDADEAVEVCALCLAAAALDFADALPDAPDLVSSPCPTATFTPLRVFDPSSPCRAYWGRAPPAPILFRFL